MTESKMKRLQKASLKLDSVNAHFREAHSTLAEDRNQWAGKVYEAQNELNDAVRDIFRADDPEEESAGKEGQSDV